MDSSGKRQDFSPFPLDSCDIIELGHLSWCLVKERHMGAKEIVMGDKESREGDCAIKDIEAVRRLDVMLESPIKAFNKLFKGSILCGLVIQILEPDNLVVLDIRIIIL
jgi:hypothetical protein